MAHRDLHGIHVLVVEDRDDSREMLRVGLERCGALVMVATTVGGIRAYTSHTSRLREKKVSIPTIAVTAYGGAARRAASGGIR
jgi:hypothetical protein